MASLAFLAVAIFLIFKLLADPLTWALGEDATGRIEDVQPHRRGTDGRRFDVTYSYEGSGGVKALGYGRIDTKGAAPPGVGREVRIRRWVVGTFSNSVMYDEDGGGSLTGYLCIGLFFTVWCGGATLFAARAWIVPVFERRLVRNGSVAEATVTEMENIGNARIPTYRVSYRFRTGTGVEQTRVEYLADEQAKRVRERERLTVIYDPSKPSRSRLYETLDYQAV